MPWSRITVWRRVTGVMDAVGIPAGPHRCPKGLRHGYGVHAIGTSVPIDMLCKWMGPASIENTAIYANALGAGEQGIAERMWAWHDADAARQRAGEIGVKHYEPV